MGKACLRIKLLLLDHIMVIKGEDMELTISFPFAICKISVQQHAFHLLGKRSKVFAKVRLSLLISS
jgi:hypothetical protein